jgi:two-component sensor histidine kinase
MIVNELMSNSCKHAFSEGKDGKITITVRQTGDTIRMEYRDNGKGFLFGEGSAQNAGIGLRILELLVQQIKGEVKISQLVIRYPAAD